MKIRLNRLLEKAGMSQAELARITKIRPSTVCDMYNNNCAFLLSSKMLKRFAQRFPVLLES